MAQVPLVVGLGVRNSIVSALLGKGSEKFNYLHRFLGRSIFVASTLHVAPYLHKYAIDDDFVAQLGKPVISTGCFGYIALILISLSSIPVIRRKAFQFFQISHWIGMVILLVSLSVHVPICLPFTLSSLSLYFLDLLLRLLFKTQNAFLGTPAVLLPLSDGLTTLLEIPSLTTGWRAGQHVYVRVFHPGMGLGKMWESHPFTIASAGAEGEGDGEPLRVFVKSVKRGWTERLFGFASDGEVGTGEDRMRFGGAKGGRRCRVLVEGPYGGTGNILFSSFSSVLLVSGGSGITFSLAQALSLQSKALLGLVRARSIDLVWIFQSEASLQAFMPYLLPLLNNASSNKTASSFKALKINLHIYITRPSSQFAYDPSLSTTLLPAHDHLYIHTGRPNLSDLVNAKVEEAAMEAKRLNGRGVNPCGLGIGACGPQGLVRSLRNVVGGLKGERMGEVGGVEVVTEAFGV
ncbi:ferric reductase like transmembrane component-domain-containing protein [Mrakia frigida]|uniref:ferric reductase family protein n=1 Tax=Mrakia frigida TaxID=29902 RepID=UPI003FCC124F